MDVETAYRRIKFQAHPNSELGRVGGPLVDEVDALRAEVRRLRAVEERARTKLARLPIEETTAYERGQADALRHVLGGRA